MSFGEQPTGVVETSRDRVLRGSCQEAGATARNITVVASRYDHEIREDRDQRNVMLSKNQDRERRAQQTIERLNTSQVWCIAWCRRLVASGSATGSAKTDRPETGRKNR